MADASCAIVNGAVSLVNAIAARKGATLGAGNRGFSEGASLYQKLIKTLTIHTLVCMLSIDASTPARITFASSIITLHMLASLDMALELFRPYPLVSASLVIL